MKTDILMNGSMVKNHISFKTGFGYPAIRRTSFLLWFQACQVRPLDLHQLQRHIQVKFRLENEKIGLTSLQCKCRIRLMIDQGDLMKPKPIKPKNKIKRKPRKNWATRCILRSRSGCKNSGKILVDDEIPVQGDSHASSSHEASLEPIFKRHEDLG